LQLQNWFWHSERNGKMKAEVVSSIVQLFAVAGQRGWRVLYFWLVELLNEIVVSQGTK
jgi:hypothetical protein